MKPSNVTALLQRVASRPVEKRAPLLIEGSPGMGKTGVVYAAACGIGAATVAFNAAAKDPVDVGGMPYPDLANGTMRYLRPDVLPAPDCGATFLFLDDIDKAPPAVQNVLLDVVLARSIHGHKLSDNVTIVAAMNLLSDRAHGNRMSTALLSRFRRISMQIDLNDFTLHAASAGFRVEVLAFNRWRHSDRNPSLYNFDDAARAGAAFPCPRTWEMVSHTLDERNPREVEREVIEGTIGKSMATEFLAFCQVRADLPSIDGILLNPGAAKVPTDPGAIAATCATLADRASPNNFANIVEYGERLPPEWTVFLVSVAARKNPDCMETRAFQVWSAAHTDALI